ncbi:MAG: PD40 domain-containing protein [Anaerolineaceae bacterium]|nr:PD40 domain-containing protein [Anaerolineaceae bacterium]
MRTCHRKNRLTASLAALCLCSLLLSACAAPQTPTSTPPPTAASTFTPLPQPTATSTPALSPSKTRTPRPTQTSTPTLPPTQTLVPSLTPPPNAFTLSVSNIRSITQLGKWGKGTPTTTAWSHDGRALAVATHLGVYLFDANTLTQLRFINTGEAVHRIAFSPDGLTLAAAGQQVRLWDVATGRLIQTLAGEIYGWFPWVAFSPGGTMLAALGIDGSPGDPPCNLYIWNAQTGDTEYLDANGFCGNYDSLSFSPDGKYIVRTDYENRILLFLNTATGERIEASRELLGVFAPTPTSDGKLLIAGPYILDATALELHTRDYYNKPSIITSDGKTWIREGDWNQAAQTYETLFWNLETDQARFTLSEAGDFGANSLSPDGSELVTFTQSGIRFWNAETGAPTRQIPWDSRVTAITFGPLSIPTTTVQFALFAANYQGQVRIIDPQSGQIVTEYAITSAPIINIAIHPNGKLLGFTVAEDKAVRLSMYNLEEEAKEDVEIVIPIFPPDPIHTWGLAFSQDGEAVAVNPIQFATIQAWNIHTGESLPNPGAKTWFYGADLAAFPNNHRVEMKANQTRIVDAFTGDILSSIDDSASFECCDRVNYAVSADYRYLAVGCGRLDLPIWNIPENRLEFVLEDHVMPGGDGCCGNIADIAFSPHGHLLASAGYDETLRFWDAAKGQLLLTILEHNAPITDIVFSADGRYLASTSHDGTLRLWGLAQ